jgi:hypothetical protein
MALPKRDKTSRLTWAVLVIALATMPLLKLIDHYRPISWMREHNAARTAPFASQVEPVATKHDAAVSCTDNQGRSVTTHAEEGWRLVKPWFGQLYYESDKGTIFVVPPGLQCNVIDN